jgi:NADP-dependent 3-hydroxy acid dehydrogenase YdfG
MPLEGSTALVTGASRGIGLAIAKSLTLAGATTFCLGRSRERLNEAVLSLGPRAIPLACDLSQRGEVARALDEMRARRNIPDVLVQNAGLFALSPLEETAPDDLASALDVNVLGPYRLVHALVPEMRGRRQGHVVTIGSIADHVALPGNTAYAASKYAARALHEVMRQEMRGSGVRVSLVSPGPVDTAMWDVVDPDTRPDLTPRALMLRPEAVAQAVLFVVTLPPDVNVDELRLSRA